MTTVVASEIEVLSSRPARKESSEWLDLPIYMSYFEKLSEDVLLDVLKICVRTSKLVNVEITSISNETWNAKDELAKDIYNMRKISNLASLYLKEGQHELAKNVLLRGWKRAGEIECKSKRFAFLMKLCELSYGFHQYRQALAVFRDIEEPTDAKCQKSYVLLGSKVASATGDVTLSLQYFQRAIDGEPFETAIRALAVLCVDLKQVGAFEAAKSTLENLASDGIENAGILTVTDFAERSVQRARNRPKTPKLQQKQFFYCACALGSALLLGLLYWIECRSLASMEWSKQ